MGRIVKGYRDSTPPMPKGSVTYAHYTLESYKEFLTIQGARVKGAYCVEVEGEFVRDEGGSDGLVLKWTSYREFYL